MRRGEVDKRYLVMVCGKWRDAKRVVELPLEKYLTRTGERRVRVEEDAGMTARTVFHARQVWSQARPPMSLLEAELHTGRTHQIRVHLSHLGFPLAGDDKYGDFPLNRTLSRDGLRRIFLHAYRLRLAHPIDQTPRVFESPLPPDLQRYMDYLNAGSTHAA
jgi:23S rRNA pseudouridine955/2504/2580 synthase